MNKLYKHNLNLIKNLIVNKDFDWIHLIIGKEGCGKSTLAIQTCKAIDPTFNASRVINDLEELKRVVRNSSAGQAILIDEGALFFFSGDAMTKDVKKIVKLFTAFRRYNLFFVVCVPCYYDIVSRIRDKRVKSGCIVYRRGVFGFFSRKRLNMIRKHRKNNSEIYPRANFVGTYPKLETQLWLNYLKKKDEILAEETKSDYIAQKVAANILGVHVNTISNLMKSGEIPYTMVKGTRKIKRSDIMDLKRQSTFKIHKPR